MHLNTLWYGATANTNITIPVIDGDDSIKVFMSPQPEGWSLVSYNKNEIVLKVGKQGRVTLNVETSAEKAQAVILSVSDAIDMTEFEEFLKQFNEHWEIVQQGRHRGYHIEETIERMFQSIRDLYQSTGYMSHVLTELVYNQNDFIKNINESLGIMIIEMFQKWSSNLNDEFWDNWVSVELPKINKRVDELTQQINDEVDDMHNKFNNLEKGVEDTIHSQKYSIESLVSAIESSTHKPYNISFLSNTSNVNSSNLQGVELDSDTMEWYVTQTDKKSEEGFVVIRNDYSGNQISNMYIPGGGHGQNNSMLNIDGVVYWYFAQGGNIYRVKYEDYTTKPRSSWEVVLGDESDSTIHGFSIDETPTGEGAFTWREAKDDKYYVHACKGKFTKSGMLNLSDDITTFDLSTILINNKDNSIQGMTILNKSDVYGLSNFTDDWFIFVSYGWWSVKSEMIVLSYSNGEITYVNTITDLNNVVVRPGERQIFEIEGLSHKRFKIGDGYASTLFFSNAGGRSGSYANRIFSFTNNDLLSYMNAFSHEFKSEINRRYSDSTNIDYLWKYGQGSFVIRQAEWGTLLDKPTRWMGGLTLPAGYAYLDTLGLRDNHGDLIQTLTIPSYNGPNETYTRFVNFSFNSSNFGEGWKPLDITQWTPNSDYGSLNKKIVSEKSLFHLTELLDYYIPEGVANFDLEGLPTNYAYTVSNTSFGAARFPSEVTYLQTCTTHNVSSDEIITFKRYIRGHIGEYGSSLVDVSYKSKWIKNVEKNM